MSGIPDEVVEAAAEALWTEDGYDVRPAEDDQVALYRADARAALAAAEGPWREHLAAQIEAELDLGYDGWERPTVLLDEVLALVRRSAQAKQQDGEVYRAEGEKHGTDDGVVGSHEPTVPE